MLNQDFGSKQHWGIFTTFLATMDVIESLFRLEGEHALVGEFLREIDVVVDEAA